MKDRRVVWIIIWSVGLYALMGGIQPLKATTFYVRSDGSDNNSGLSWNLAKKSIQAAVNASQNGDTVLVTNGTYILTSAISIAKAIWVRSVNGTGVTAVNGGYPVTTNACFELQNAAAVIDGFTITNAYDRAGCDEQGHGHGGFYIDHGIVQNCVIAGNTPYGVYMIDGLVQNCTIAGNEAGVSMNYGTVQLCQISENSGGGLSIYDEGLVLSSTIASNAGGGVYNDGGFVHNCTIIGNTSSSTPSGIWNQGLVQNCLIYGNYGGGGVYNRYAGVLRNCVIAGNWTRFSGGGVWNELGTVQNCTMVGNAAELKGGGMYNYVDTSITATGGAVANCIVYFNSASNSSDYFAGEGTTNIFICTPTAVAGTGNFTNNPSFVNAGSGYGTNYVAGDLRLQAGSSCINTGTNQDWMTGAIDFDGNARIIENRVDVGAYEYNGGTPLPAPAINISINDISSNSVSVSSGTPISVKVELAACKLLDLQADWWILVQAPAGCYYQNALGQWLPFADITSVTPVYQGGLFNLGPTEVLNLPGLQYGTYTFYFGVDLMDGRLDLSGFWFDSIALIVQ